MQYVNVPDWNWRPLVVTGLGEPKAIAVDHTNYRLFVADHAVPAIFWYQLQKLPNGKLITDGHQHLAVAEMKCHFMAVDNNGNLFYSGKWSPAMPQPSPPLDAIFKHTAIQLATGDTVVGPQVWNRDNTGSTPKSYTPGALALDAFNLYWGNQESGRNHGAVVRAGQSAPEIQPETTVHQLADNTEQVFGIGLTTTFLFYGTPEGIYGVPKTKTTDVCTESSCKLVSPLSTQATAMIWDGDGTMYVADHLLGKIYSFPSGSADKHNLEAQVDCPNVYGAAMLILSESKANCRALSVPLFAVFATFLLAMQRE